MIIIQRDEFGRERALRTFSDRFETVVRLSRFNQWDSWYELAKHMLDGSEMTDGQYWYRYEQETYEVK